MSLGRKKHSPRFRRGTRTSPSQSWTAVVLFLVRMSSRAPRSEEHTSELQSQSNLVCRLLLEKKTRHHDDCPSYFYDFDPTPPGVDNVDVSVCSIAPGNPGVELISLTSVLVGQGCRLVCPARV